MPTLILDVLRYVFLALLYIFVARAVKAIHTELRPAKTSAPKRRASGGAQPAGRKPRKPPVNVYVLEGKELKGRTFPLGKECLIGRADKCQIVLDDNYASQVHARIYEHNEGFVAEDLGSTNGTYLNGRRLTSPAEIHRGDRLKIGKTVMEMRK